MAVGLGSIAEIVNTQLARNQFNSQDSLVLITQQLVARNQEERAEQAVNFDRPDLVAATKEIARLTSFKEKVNDNVMALKKARNAIEWVEKYLDDMRTELTLIQGSTSNEDRAAAAAQFNEYFKNINGYVHGANQQTKIGKLNLVGNTTGPNWNTDDIYTRTSENGGFVAVEGAYLGNDFEITDGDGLKWRLNRGENTYYQHKIDGTNEKTGLSISADDLTLDSYDMSTGAISFSGDTPLSGTVTTAGLGLLTSEFYNDFATDTDVTTAIAEIDAAITEFDRLSGSIVADASLLEGRIDLADKKISVLRHEQRNIRAEELDASAAETAAANLKLRLAINNIESLSQVNNGLIENMLSLSSGPAKGFGVFGMLGY